MKSKSMKPAGPSKSINLASKQLRWMSPAMAKVTFVSLVTLAAIGGIVIVANQAAPSASAAPVVKAAAPAPAAASGKKVAAVKPNGAKSAKTANATASAQTAAVPDVVTVTGCLEEKGDTFRLKDTGGTGAPKSRSWKTLGLTKHATAVTVVDGTSRMQLASHVGERVSVTGTLADKELQGRSLQSLDPSCN